METLEIGRKLFDAMQENEMKPTKQRWALCQTMEQAAIDNRNLTVEEICQEAFGAGENSATTYRFVRDMETFGLLSSVDLGDGRSRYEVRKESHGHCVNVKDGTVSEFSILTPEIWAMIQAQAKTAGFTNINRVKLEIFGNN